jgi:hypothetical protein
VVNLPGYALQASCSELWVRGGLVELLALEDILGAAHDAGNTLVNILGTEIHDAGLACDGQAARLLHEEAHGCGYEIRVRVREKGGQRKLTSYL